MSGRLSVIVPTLQRSRHLVPLVTRLADHPRVGEIIVINNSPERLELPHARVRVLNQPTNLFVNPSWNLGVAEARFELICICNDDILFDLRVLDTATRALRLPVGIIGPHPTCFVDDEREPSTARRRRIWVSPVYERTPGFGTLMFMRKECYAPIPDDLKVWCGDDYLFYQQKHRNLLFRGAHIATSMSSTSGAPEFSVMKNADTTFYLERLAAHSPYLDRYSREGRLLARLRDAAHNFVGLRRSGSREV
jgi:glycosyltransferase involved in cell wall biosynthesis